MLRQKSSPKNAKQKNHGNKPITGAWPSSLIQPLKSEFFLGFCLLQFFWAILGHPKFGPQIFGPTFCCVNFWGIFSPSRLSGDGFTLSQHQVAVGNSTLDPTMAGETNAARGGTVLRIEAKKKPQGVIYFFWGGWNVRLEDFSLFGVDGIFWRKEKGGWCVCELYMFFPTHSEMIIFGYALTAGAFTTSKLLDARRLVD